MSNKLIVFVMLTAVVSMLSVPVMAEQWYERSESLVIDEFDVDDHDIEYIGFENIDFTEFEYRGDEDATTLEVSVTYRVRADDREIADDVLADFNLDAQTRGSRVDVRLEHPKQRDNGVFDRIFNRDWSRWEVVMTVSGPRMVHVDLDAEFSKVEVEQIAYGLSLDAQFSDANISDIIGSFEAHCEFGELTVTDLAGSFDVSGEFSEIDMEVTELADDSSLSTEFGNADLDLPRGAGAVFVTQSSFGGIDFNLSGDATLNSRRRRSITLHNGGPEIELSASFGSIEISDTARSRSTEHIGNRSNQTERQPAGSPEPEPRFTEGTVRTVRFRGYELLNHRDLEIDLGIDAGKHYTRDELDEAVDDLPGRNRFIESAWYRIDPAGDMTIWIDEATLFDMDGDGIFTFNRAAGFGLGGELTLTSMVGPFSDISVKGVHHWGTKEWTYEVSGEKRFFTRNHLAIGGSYRNAYESSLDWAIAEEDRDANSFILGLEVDNIYQVEGSTAYVSQSLGDWVTVSATYFDEEFSSLSKNTNWSLFNHKHTKAPNALLSTGSVGTITGMRYAIELTTGNGISNTVLHVEMENTQEDNTTLPQYTRYLGSLTYTQLLYASQAILARFAGGYSDDVLPDQKAFRLGGLNTLRGFSHGMIPEPPTGADGFDYYGGGNRMVLANIEYQFGRFDNNVFNDFGISMFFDVGGVWRDGEDMRPEDLKRDVGIGLNLSGFTDPIDVVDLDDDVFRINWAVPVGNEFHKSRWTVNFSRPF